MQYNCLNILKSTEAHLKYTHDVSLKDASPQALHDALGRAVMMAISDNWTYAKQQRVIKTAMLWLQQNETDLQPRFDVIEIYAPEGVDTKKPIIHHLEDAFQ